MTISWNWRTVSGCQSGGMWWEGVIRMGQNQGGLWGLESSCILTTAIVSVNLRVWWNGRELYPYIQTLESLLEIKPVNSKGNQAWIFIGRTDAEAEAEAPILWPPDVKNWLIVKDPYAGKDWRQEEKGMTEDEMVGWHHRLDGHELEQALGFGDGQGSLACCSPWGRKELNTTERLNWTELIHIYWTKCTFLVL